MDQATADEQEWTASWAKTCKDEQEDVPVLATVREILMAAAELGPALDKKAGLLHRIERWRRTRTGDVTGICTSEEKRGATSKSGREVPGNGEDIVGGGVHRA